MWNLFKKKKKKKESRFCKVNILHNTNHKRRLSNNYQTPFAPEKIAVSRVTHVDVFTSCQFSLVQLG